MNLNTIAILASFLLTLSGILTNNLILVVIGIGGFLISIILKETKRLEPAPLVQEAVEVVPEPTPVVEKPKRTRAVRATKTNNGSWQSPAKQAPKKTITGAKRGPKPKK